MTFKYFEKPEIFTGLRNKKTSCDTCGQERFCFDAEAFLGTEKISSICPDCLSNGKLIEKDIFTCEGDISELERQLKEIHPKLADSEIENLVKQKTNELEKTTPLLVSWQDWSWPCSDGDYCKFIGYGSRPFYNSVATKTTGQDLFKNSFYYNLKDNSNIDNLWEEVLPESEIRNYNESNEMSTLFYVFKSLNSDKIITIWDCN